MSALYAVIGHPIRHSLSPRIHAEFARQTGEKLIYTAIEAPLDGFAEAVAAFRANGGLGLNVTVPFKQEAFALATELTPRARRAGAVNTLNFADDKSIVGDTTDGVGLQRDLEHNLGLTLKGQRILLLGAGGAARGVLEPLLERNPLSLVIANRTATKAESLARRFAGMGALRGIGLKELDGEMPFDLVINATSTGLSGQRLPLPNTLFAADAVAYDMVYGSEPTPFLRWAQSRGAALIADGLGMLVEQAAESFYIWRGKRPETQPVIAHLRHTLVKT